MIRRIVMLAFTIGISLCTVRMSVDLFEHSLPLSVFFIGLFFVCVVGVYYSVIGIIDALYKPVRGFKRVDKAANKF